MRGILAVLLCAASAAGSPKGYLQIKASAGVLVELEGVGSRSAESVDGVTFRGLEPGRYWVTLRRDGFEPQRASVDVEIGAVAVYRPKAWQPIPNAVTPPKTKNEGVGALIVQTFPVDATVDAKRLGWRKIEKGDAPFIAANVPAGAHKLTFCNTYKCIDYRATIVPNRLLSIIVDFDPGHIEDVSDLHRRQLADWRRTCADGNDRACKRACDLDVALAPRRRSVACESLTEQEALVKAPSSPREPEVVAVSRGLDPPCVAEPGPSSDVTLTSEGTYDVYYGERLLGRGGELHAKLPRGCVELRAVSPGGGVERSVRVEVDGTSKTFRLPLTDSATP